MRVRVIGFEIDTSHGAMPDGARQLNGVEQGYVVEALRERGETLTHPDNGVLDILKGSRMQSLADSIEGTRGLEGDADAGGGERTEDEDDDLSFDAMLAALGQAAVMFAARANQRREERLKARREQREREAAQPSEDEQPKETAAQ